MSGSQEQPYREGVLYWEENVTGLLTESTLDKTKIQRFFFFFLMGICFVSSHQKVGIALLSVGTDA